MALLDKGLFYLPVLLLMEHFFGLYGIAFAGAATLVFSLTAGIFSASAGTGVCSRQSVVSRMKLPKMAP